MNREIIPKVKKIINNSMTIAKEMDSGKVTPEHITLSILKDKGKIILTVPFGKPVWQHYHQNYNWEKLLELTKGSTIIEKQTFTLRDQNKPFYWEQTEPEDMEDIIYDDRAHGVGCFVMQKND